MAETHDWHYAKGNQQYGPVSSADLKQLAASGTLAPTDMLWRQDWAEWKTADSLKGLFPQGVAGNGTSVPPPRSHRHSMRAATDAADQVSQTLWFLDLKFERFATPKLIGVIFGVSLICIVIVGVLAVAHTLWTYPALQAGLIVVAQVIVLVLLAVVLRVCLELCLIGFRIAEHLSYLRHLGKSE